MEVHHHPKIEKRSFKEYLLEFLMLFLAVTLGFFAESLREKMVSKEKELHYIKSMVEDIKKDTVELLVKLQRQNFTLSKMDSALSIPVSRLTNIDAQDSFFHHFFFFYSWEDEFFQNSNTYSQLVNAGGFSVIHHQETIDQVSRFNTFCQQQVNGNGKYYLDYYDKVVQLGTQLMDMPVIPPSRDDSMHKIILHHVEVFHRYDPSLLRQLYSTIRYEKGCLIFYMMQEAAYYDMAKELLEYLNKEYKLKI